MEWAERRNHAENKGRSGVLGRADATCLWGSGENANKCRWGDGTPPPGGWAEVRTLVVGEVQPAVEEPGEQVVHTHMIYFSRKVSAQEFGRLALMEMHRRGVENAKQVAAVMDGTDWEQSFVDFHCPQAIRILDFAHAAEHMNEIGEFLHGEHTPESQAWLKDHSHRLKHEGPDKLLMEFEKLQRKHPTAEAIASDLAYLKNAKHNCNIRTFKRRGGRLAVAWWKMAINSWCRHA